MVINSDAADKGEPAVRPMVQNVLLISPDFPPNYHRFTHRLREAGARVFGIGQSGFGDLPEMLRNDLSWYVSCPLENPHAFEEALRHLASEILPQHGWGSLDLVESHNEHWMGHEARANEILGLEGIKSEDLPPLKRKSVMKAIFQEAGLPTAESHLVSGAKDLHAAVAKLGFPMILKPDTGVGAGGVRRLDRPEDLGNAASKMTIPSLAERFIAAPIVTYDGLAGWDSEVLFESSLAYGAGVLESLMGGDTFFYTQREIPSRLAAAGRDLVRRFKLRRKFFHFEFFDTPEGLMPIEINARPPGGAILDMMNYSADDDLYNSWATLVTKGPQDVIRTRAKKKFFVAYTSRRDHAWRHSHEEVLARFGSAMVEHGENPALFQQAMGRYRYLYRTEDMETITRVRDFILAR